MIEEEYTPDDASVAPKRAPTDEVAKKSMSMAEMMADETVLRDETGVTSGREYRQGRY